MEEVKYIMVTNWDYHWNQLNNKWNNSTLFTFPLIKDNLINSTLPYEAKTLFIKKTKENVFEKAWIGMTKNYRKENYQDKLAIRFEVDSLVETDCPVEFKSFTNGWHLNKSFKFQKLEGNSEIQYNNLQPNFFNEMANCDAFTFELYCYYLLRLLGIHDIHKIPQDNNRGKADGFFRFQTLSVIYDATLESKFLEKKETQIENYINQLKKEKIVFGTTSYTVKDTHRQVWIITRGAKTSLLKTDDHIKVKEIPFTQLISVYNKRFGEELGVTELCDALKDLF